MSQIIKLNKGNLELPSGLKLHFEQAEITVDPSSRGGGVVSSSAAPAAKKSQPGAKNTEEDAPRRGKRGDMDLEREIAQFIKDNPGCTTEKIHAHLKDTGRKLNYKQVAGKVGRMKNAGDIIAEARGKYSLSEDYFSEATKKPFNLND